MNERDLRLERIREASRVTRSGDEAAIVGLLDSPEPAVRQRAVITVLRRRITAALPELRGRIEDEPDPEVRSAFALTLAELAEPESRSALHTLLDDPQEVNRRMALRGLSLLGDETVIDPAVDTYKRAVSRLGKHEALNALAHLETENARSELRNLLSDEKNWWWRRRIRRSLKSAPARRHS